MATELSSSAGREEEEEEVDVIPESILSLSKDARYIRQCQELLQDALSVLLERKESLLASDRGDPERRDELRKQLAWWISCILYLLVSIKAGRTIGMEALGLSFSDQNSASAGESERNTTVATTTRLGRSLSAGLLLMMAATGGVAWDYLREARTFGNDDDCVDNPQQSRQRQEGLRGRERRLLHERLRQQMLARASNTSGGTPAPVQEQSSPAGRDTEQHTGNGVARLSPSGRFLSVFRKLSKFLFHVYSFSDGPHDIVHSDTEGNENNNNENSENNNNNNNNGTSTLYSVALWMVRLHLAQFLFTGNYATLTHRVLGLRQKRDRTVVAGGTTTTTPTTTTTTILSRPNTDRIIGLVIFLQASTALARTASHWFARAAAHYLEARAFARAKKRDPAHRTEVTDAELRTTLEAIFGKQQSRQSHQRLSPSPSPPSGARLQTSQSRVSAAVVCTICRSDRKHPAAPTSCGHVFCWDCLLRWISTVRPECPLCRAPCTAKDVLALHNYRYGPEGGPPGSLPGQ